MLAGPMLVCVDATLADHLMPPRIQVETPSAIGSMAALRGRVHRSSPMPAARIQTRQGMTPNPTSDAATASPARTMLATTNRDEIHPEDRRPTAVASIVIARLQTPTNWRW